ncbi:MAG: mechanosensitive ion channel family protein [Kiloniellales bacterium]|nr:mechanosensitive ion channel family protein [Kiloniellales bacterium]
MPGIRSGSSRRTGLLASGRRLLPLGLIIVILAAAWAPGAAHAQAFIGQTAGEETPAAEEVALPEELTPAQVRGLVAGLSDEQVRAILIEQLDKAAKPEAEGADAGSLGMLMGIEDVGGTLQGRLAEVLAQAPEAPSMLTLVATRLEGSGGILITLLGLLVVLGLGFAARFFWRRFVGKHQEKLAARSADIGAYASLAVIGDAIVWLLLELSGVVIFYVAAIVVVFTFWHGDEAARFFLGTFVSATAGTLFVMAMTEFFLPFKWRVYRLLPLEDRPTLRVRRFMLALALIWNFGFLTCALLAIYGAPPTMHLFLVMMVGTVFILLLIVGLWTIRKDVAALIRGDSEESGGWSYLRRLLADSWHYLASAYMLLVFGLAMGQLLLQGEQTNNTNTGLISLLLFVAAPALDIMIGRFLSARYGADSAVCAALRRAIRVLIVVGAAAVFLSLWGFHVEALEGIGIGGWLVAATINVGVTALVGYVIWQLVSAMIDSRLEAEGGGEPGEHAAPGGEGGGAGATRTATLLPLLRSFAFATIAVMAVMTALSGLGVDIGPLLAGAGVVGIAIGFGAQTLVRDIVSGAFFLIDDAFRMGEYIDVGAAKGTVEKISVRSLRLRHHRGPLNTIPFGEIRTLTNYSRDWVIMKLPMRLTYDTDPVKVKKIVKQIGLEMSEDPDLGPMLLDPPKSQGVLQMDDSAMILRVKFMAKPGEQFVLRRELLHRIRAAFAREGITFASREVTVHVSGDAENGKTKEAAAAAARRILDDEAERQQAAAAGAGDTR